MAGKEEKYRLGVIFNKLSGDADAAGPWTHFEYRGTRPCLPWPLLTSPTCVLSLSPSRPVLPAGA